jgi:hypothetical protein
MEGWIKLHRKMLNWEWYDDANTWRLFVHCLLKANHKDKKWQGIKIKRGSFITSSLVLAEEIKLTRQQIRTSLSKLILTNEITIKTTNKYTYVTVNKYNEYQQNNQQNNLQITNKQPANNQQITTTKEYKNNISINTNMSLDHPKPSSKENSSSLKQKSDGRNERVQYLLDEFNRRWGYPPTDKRPRFEAWNIVRRIKSHIESFGKEATMDNFKKAVCVLYDGIEGEDWGESVQNLGTIRRKLPVYLRSRGGDKNG